MASLAQLRGDAEETAAFASRALAESKEGEWLLSSTARGYLAWPSGSVAGSRKLSAPSRPALPGWQAAGQPTLTGWHRYQLAQVQRALGRLDMAIQTYEEALRATAVPGRPPAPTVGLVYVGLAEVTYQRNELDSALRYVTEGIALERQFLAGTSPTAGLVTLAWIRQAAGDPGGSAGGDRRSRACLAGDGWPAQPVPGAAGTAAASPGRGGRGRAVDA